MSLAKRLEGLEKKDCERAVRAAADQLGMTVSNGELREVVDSMVRASKLAPPLDVGGGMVDLEPTLRCMARLLDLDPEAMIEEAEKLLAESDRS